MENRTEGGGFQKEGQALAGPEEGTGAPGEEVAFEQGDYLSTVALETKSWGVQREVSHMAVGAFSSSSLGPPRVTGTVNGMEGFPASLAYFPFLLSKSFAQECQLDYLILIVGGLSALAGKPQGASPPGAQIAKSFS